MDPLRYDGKLQIPSLPHDLPALGTPRIRFLQKEVRRHTGKDGAIRRLQLILFLTVLFKRKVKITGLTDDARILADRRITPVYITMFTARTDFMTSMPGIPDHQEMPPFTCLRRIAIAS